MNGCPLCGVTRAIEIERIQMATVLERLRLRAGREVTPELVAPLRRHDTIVLVACAGCGLQYFPGSEPAGPEFYDLMSSGDNYHRTARWEFGEVGARIGVRAAVADLGCGDATFLQGLKAARRVGVDHDPSAAERLARAGVEFVCADFDEAGRRLHGQMDVVTAFHLVEHVPDVSAMVTAARSMLRPRGRLFISTPNRERLVKDPPDPLDCPPHHLSRWSGRQMEFLASRFGLQLESLVVQPIVRDALASASRRWARRCLSSLGGGRAAWVGRAIEATVRRLPEPVLRPLAGQFPPGPTLLAHFRLKA